MNQLRLDNPLPARHDQLCADAEGIDRFCSSSLWAVPALEAFRPDVDELVVGGNEGASVAFAVGTSPQVGAYLAPLESTWGLGSPVAARSSVEGAQAVAEMLRSRERERLAILLGLDGELLREICRHLGKTTRVQLLDRTVRHSASLIGGLDGFLSRRSRKFRAGLRRAEAKANEAEVRFERHPLTSADALEAVYNDVLEVEAHSWKTLDGNGVASGPMVHFTRGVLERAAEADRALLIFAYIGEERVGYIHGAYVNRMFRGLQMSFHHERADLSLGNLLQRQMIGWLCELGGTNYDLGSELPYKRRWAETAFETTGIAIIR